MRLFFSSAVQKKQTARVSLQSRLLSKVQYKRTPSASRTNYPIRPSPIADRMNLGPFGPIMMLPLLCTSLARAHPVYHYMSRPYACTDSRYGGAIIGRSRMIAGFVPGCFRPVCGVMYAAADVEEGWLFICLVVGWFARFFI